MMKNSISLFLPLALLLDLTIPFFLAPFYKGYSHSMQVMSVLGNNKLKCYNKVVTEVANKI